MEDILDEFPDIQESLGVTEEAGEGGSQSPPGLSGAERKVLGALGRKPVNLENLQPLIESPLVCIRDHLNVRNFDSMPLISNEAVNFLD